MPAVYHHSHRVLAAEIDGQGHANNIAYLHWLQSAALAHSDAQGWPTERYRESGGSWVVRTHFIEYRRPAYADDEITVVTWVAEMQRVSSLRKYQILRQGELLARAETNWVFIDARTGRLTRIPAAVAESFEVVASPDHDTRPNA